MTICALLLARQFYDLGPSPRLKYATLGLLFVNVSIGGTLTHFAAPPVLMVARPLGLGHAFMLAHFGWRAVLGDRRLDLVYFVLFPRELRLLATRRRRPTSRCRTSSPPPAAPSAGAGLVTAVHLAFMAWTVFNAHYPALFRRRLPVLPRFRAATAAYQSQVELQVAAAGRLLPRRAGDPRRAARLVDRSGARRAVRDAAVFRRRDPHRLQRQRADHLPGDAGAQPGRPQGRGRRGRGDRRRLDSHRQRAEPGWPGPAEPILRRRHLAARPVVGAAVPTLIAALAFRLL